MDERHTMRISELLLSCYDGSAGREDLAELEALLDQNRAALEYCVEISRELNYFHCLAQVPLSQPESVKGLDTDFMSELGPQQQLDLLGDFAEYEKQAAAIHVAKPAAMPEPLPVKKLTYERPVRTINKFSLAVGIFGIAALLLMVMYVRLAPPAPYEVATICDSINAEWSSDLSLSAGSRLTSNSKPIRLTQGIVKLRTDDQVDIVVEAPSEFHFSSYSEVTLNYGKLFARVSETGYGFSVVTPNSKVVDLGTEFGVLSHIDGNTEVHMYKGKANVFAGEKHQRKTSELLGAGAAVKVDSRNAGVRTIALDEEALARTIDSQSKFVWRGQKAIRLTDLLLGGDGFGSATPRGVEYDPLTGAVVTSAFAWYRTGPEKRTPVSASPYLDSIFVPAGNGRDVVIDSAGHRFRDCPATSGLYYANIACYKDWAFFEPLQHTFDQSRKAFSDPGLLYLHSNIGLTVDLDAVRQTFGGLRLCSFSTYAGILRLGENTPDASEVDVWVLVDGQLRSSRKALRADQGYDIQVPLAETDRFLTLVVTDGGTVYADGFPANHFDTCGFAEPVFEVELPEK